MDTEGEKKLFVKYPKKTLMKFLFIFMITILKQL